MIEKTRVLEHFKMSITPSIRPIPSSVHFDGSRITACKVIDWLIQEIEQDVKLQGKDTSRIQSFVSRIETPGTWILISLAFSVSSDRQGRERVQ